MNRMLSIAYPTVVIIAVLMVIYMAAWSPSARCASTEHHVWLTTERACLPINAFIPAK